MRTLVDPPILVYKYWLQLYKYRNPRMGMEIEFRKYKRGKNRMEKEKLKVAHAA